jgi:hypothetical protein
MRTLLISVVVTVAIIGSVSVSAQTPDGQTPAVETVCDPLIGATPGLYGLCVAYCEAHDADILSPGGDPAELDVPNRKILQNYNKKKTEFDPPMPCVQQGVDDCPCWTAEQVSIVLPPSMDVDANYGHACFNGPSVAVLENFDYGKNQSPGIQMSALNFTGEKGCHVKNFDYPGGPPSTSQPAEPEEVESCKAILAAHANANKVDGMVWDCFQ